MIRYYFLIAFLTINAVLFAKEKESVLKHSPTIAMLSSTAIPGGGQLYNKRKIKSALFFTAATTSMGLAVYYHNQFQKKHSSNYDNHKNQAVTFFIITYLYSILDAYVDAHFFEYDQLKIKADSYSENAISLKVSYSF